MAPRITSQRINSDCRQTQLLLQRHSLPPNCRLVPVLDFRVGKDVHILLVAQNQRTTLIASLVLPFDLVSPTRT